MEDLQLVLFVLGAIAIIAVLLHGIWSIKKENKAKSSIRDAQTASFGQESERRDRDGFDDFGLGPVVVKERNDASPIHAQEVEPIPEMIDPQQASYTDPKQSDDAVSQTSEQQEPEFSLSAEPSPKRRQEPVIRPVAADEPQVEQMPLDLGQGETVDKIDDKHVEEPQEPSVEEEELGEPQDVLALHLVAKEGQVIQGADLLPCLLALNFKYGDMNIFHRHQDNAGTGKVIFSMANMVKPGVFDPDTMEQFTTPGVVVFLTLPCYGDALMNFSNMLNSVQQLADDLDALVLDGQRQPWTETTKFEYVQRIKALKL